MDKLPTATTLSCCLLIPLVLYLRPLFSKSTVPLPPGPTRYPIVGSALSIPRDRQEWLIFSEWAQTYGHVVYFRILGRDFVALNSVKSINDVLLQQGANSSDRPPVQMVGPLYAARLMLKVGYGYNITGAHDPLIATAERCLTQIGETFELGRFLVEFIPPLRYVPAWFPGAGWKRTAAYFKTCLEEMVVVPYNMVKIAMDLGQSTSSFTSDAIQEAGTLDEAKEDLVMWSAHALYAGGTDTSVAGVESFFMAMIMYPDVQLKAQQELDRVVGSSRLPCGADCTQLPYLTAVMKEVLRMFPVAPLALPHAASSDIVYENMFIPKGATIFGNTWAILHDPEIYPDPMEFKPERFLGEHAQPDPKDLGGFGHGRRRCPAADFAQESMMILFALALSTFNVLPFTDDEGNKIIPKGEYTHRIIPHPKEFPYEIVPRSSAKAMLIRLACADTIYA
ncbi:lantipeptide [Pleurotus pulmonarius]|nr:lantipeptide [Pleurotus pulmonarius]